MTSKSPITTPPALVTVPMTVVIPTGSYANIQPVVEGIGTTFEEAQKDAIRKAQAFYDSVESPVSLTVKGETPKVESSNFKPVLSQPTGVTVLFDEANHKYEEGWLGGSTFAGNYVEKFPKEEQAARFAAKSTAEVPFTPTDIIEMWEKNAEASTSFGTSVHAALELYGKYHSISQVVKGSDVACLNKNPFLAHVTKAFFDEERLKEDAFYEVFVANEQFKICGFIDRLKVVDRAKKIVRIQDYKTNHDILKEEKILDPFKGKVSNDSIGKYTLQFHFYGWILEQAGYTVEGYDLFWLDVKAALAGKPCWKTFSSDGKRPAINRIDVGSEIIKTRG